MLPNKKNCESGSLNRTLLSSKIHVIVIRSEKEFKLMHLLFSGQFSLNLIFRYGQKVWLQ